MGQSPDSSSYNTQQEGFPLVQGNADMKDRISSPQRYTSKPTKICKKDSILLSVRAPVGTVGRANQDLCIGRGLCAIQSNCIEFVYQYLLKNENSWKSIEQGGTFTAINSDDIKNFPLYIPLKNECNKIAAFLSLIDKRIEKQRQLVESLKKYKRGLLSAIFDRKIRFKDDNGNNFPDWELKTVADVLNYEQPQKYIVFSENYNDEYETPVLTANKAFILGYTNEETGVYSKGETIIYDDFTMDFKFVDFSFKVKSSTIKMLTCKNFNDLYFMYNLLLSLNLMPQSHQRSYISILEPTKIFVPCYDEQLIISKVLRKVDSYVDQHNKYLDTLEKCKKGLLQQMFI